MKNKVDKYCDKVQKETEKLLSNLFGESKDIKYYLTLKKQTKLYLEKFINHDVSKITVGEIKKYKLGYDYAKYKTLEKILNVYTESACLSLMKDKLEDYNE